MAPRPPAEDAESDGPHQEIFRGLAELVSALERGSRAAIPRLLDFLGERVVSHFGAEEWAMAPWAYPGRASTRRPMHVS